MKTIFVTEAASANGSATVKDWLPVDTRYCSPSRVMYRSAPSEKPQLQGGQLLLLYGLAHLCMVVAVDHQAGMFERRDFFMDFLLQGGEAFVVSRAYVGKDARVGLIMAASFCISPVCEMPSSKMPSSWWGSCSCQTDRGTPSCEL